MDCPYYLFVIWSNMRPFKALSKILEQLRKVELSHMSQLIVHSALCGTTLLSHGCQRYVNFGRISKTVGWNTVYLKMPGFLEASKKTLRQVVCVERQSFVGREIKGCALGNSYSSTPYVTPIVLWAILYLTD